MGVVPPQRTSILVVSWDFLSSQWAPNSTGWRDGEHLLVDWQPECSHCTRYCTILTLLATTPDTIQMSYSPGRPVPTKNRGKVFGSLHISHIIVVLRSIKYVGGNFYMTFTVSSNQRAFAPCVGYPQPPAHRSVSEGQFMYTLSPTCWSHFRNL